MSTFHVQGRLIERRGPVIVRDETRRVDADDRDEASRIAQAWGGDRFTVWIWAIDGRLESTTWDLVERLDPPRQADRRQQLARGAAGPVRLGSA